MDYFNSNKFEQCRADSTNTVAEIQGATRAIKLARQLGKRKLMVNTDLEVIVNAVNGKLEQWKGIGWRGVSDRREWEELDEVIRTNRDMDIRFQLITSTSNPRDREYHREAHNLARRGAELHY